MILGSATPLIFWSLTNWLLMVYPGFIFCNYLAWRETVSMLCCKKHFGYSLVPQSCQHSAKYLHRLLSKQETAITSSTTMTRLKVFTELQNSGSSISCNESVDHCETYHEGQHLYFSLGLSLTSMTLQQIFAAHLPFINRIFLTAFCFFPCVQRSSCFERGLWVIKETRISQIFPQHILLFITKKNIFTNTFRIRLAQTLLFDFISVDIQECVCLFLGKYVCICEFRIFSSIL